MITRKTQNEEIIWGGGELSELKAIDQDAIDISLLAI